MITRQRQTTGETRMPSLAKCLSGFRSACTRLTRAPGIHLNKHEKVLAFTSKPSKAQIERRLERWCQAHSCWIVGENSISYGWEAVKMPPRRELMKMYNQASERKRKADERWRTLAEMLNPMVTA